MPFSGNSKSVTSNQDGLHPRLRDRWETHKNHPFQRPVAEHGREAWEIFTQWKAKNSDRPLLLDGGCGTGESSFRLAKEFPQSCVVGVDKSIHRLGKSPSSSETGNVLLLRSDLQDFIQLSSGAVQFQKVFLFYPNPWPKAEHLQRRWYAHPVFPTLLSLAPEMEVRTNWLLYVQELSQVLTWSGWTWELNTWAPEEPWTAFERKYQASGQELYRLTARRGT